MIELPIVVDDTSGLAKVRGVWCTFYYEDGNYRRFSTGTNDLNTAVVLRNQLHLSLRSDGAVYKSKVKPTLQAAINNPKGEDCIYRISNYRVVVDGKTIGSSSTMDGAKKIRNKYIEQHYK